MAPIKIEIFPLGYVHVAVVQPSNAEKAERVLALYRALRPEIEALERAARVEGPRVTAAVDVLIAPRQTRGSDAGRSAPTTTHPGAGGPPEGGAAP